MQVSKATVVINTATGLIEEVRNFTTAGIDYLFGEASLVFPGFVDIHVHGRGDQTGKQTYKEDYETLGMAAINGGVVAVASMPNLPLPPTTDAIYGELLELTKESGVTVVPYAAIAPGSRPLKRFKVPYKGFLAESVNDLKFTSEEEADETLRHYGGEDVSLHCDDNEVLERCKAEPSHERRRPPESEVRAIGFAIWKHEEYKFHELKIVHCSTKDGLNLIKEAKKRGLRIFTEATPHHASTPASVITDENRTLWQMNPPLRNWIDVSAIEEGLMSGDIDALASDHAPHTPEEKGLGEKIGRLVTVCGRDQKVPSGVPMLDTYGAFVSWLMVVRRFSPLRIAAMCSYKPGQWLSQFLPLKGRGYGYGGIEKGRIGSFTVIDLGKPNEVKRNNLKTKCRWSPFEGHVFPGRVTHTIVRGMVYVN